MTNSHVHCPAGSMAGLVGSRMELECWELFGASQNCDGCGSAWSQEAHLEGDKLEMVVERAGPLAGCGK